MAETNKPSDSEQTNWQEHDQADLPAKRVKSYVWNGTNWVRDSSSTTAAYQFATTTDTNVAGSASSVTLLASNANRKEATIQNDSTAILYIKEGTTTSATDYKFKLYQDDIYRTNNYTGRIDGIWTSATGTARVTES